MSRLSFRSRFAGRGRIGGKKACWEVGQRVLGFGELEGVILRDDPGPANLLFGARELFAITSEGKRYSSLLNVPE